MSGSRRWCKILFLKDVRTSVLLFTSYAKQLSGFYPERMTWWLAFPFLGPTPTRLAYRQPHPYVALWSFPLFPPSPAGSGMVLTIEVWLDQDGE